MNETQLALLEEGLAKLLKRFKQNGNSDDKRRAKAALDAKTALRKIILASAIKGQIKDITVIASDKGSKFGWEVIDHENKVVRYFA